MRYILTLNMPGYLPESESEIIDPEELPAAPEKEDAEPDAWDALLSKIESDREGTQREALQ